MDGKYAALTVALQAREEPEVVLTFDELDAIVEGLPQSARMYSSWWANKATSQAHSRAWLNAGRRVSPDFRARRATFTLLSEFDVPVTLSKDAAPVSLSEFDAPIIAPKVDPLLMEFGNDGSENVAASVESTLSLEQDLENHLVHHLGSLEPGLTLVGRQVDIDVGRIDILAQASSGEKVVIELELGEAKDTAIGQITMYMGWYARADGTPPRAVLVAASFPETLRYAAAAVPGLRLVKYRVQLTFEDVDV